MGADLWDDVLNDTPERRVQRYEVRMVRLNWLGGGLLAMVAVLAALPKENYPDALLAVWATLLLIGGAVVASARVGFQHAASLLTSGKEPAAFQAAPSPGSAALQAPQGQPSPIPWPRGYEILYRLGLVLVGIVGAILLLLVWWAAFSGPSDGGGTRILSGDRGRVIAAVSNYYFLSPQSAPSMARQGVPVRERVAALVLTYPEAKCRRDVASGSWYGVAPTPEELRFIHALARTLAACATSANHVVVKVWGFSSTSPVNEPAQCGAATSDQANTIVAEDRARTVAQLIARDTGSNPSVEVTYHRWNSYAAMKAARRYNDRSLEGRYSAARGALNRRVEVRISRAGACEARMTGSN